MSIQTNNAIPTFGEVKTITPSIFFGTNTSSANGIFNVPCTNQCYIDTLPQLSYIVILMNNGYNILNDCMSTFKASGLHSVGLSNITGTLDILDVDNYQTKYMVITGLDVTKKDIGYGVNTYCSFYIKDVYANELTNEIFDYGVYVSITPISY